MANDWIWVAASCIGTSHLRLATPKQDAFMCLAIPPNSSLFFSIVCDGAGSARWGGVGAWLTCRIMTRKFREYLSVHQDFPREEDILDWVDDVRDYLHRFAASRNADISEFSTTMVVALSDGARTLTAHIGDGCVVGRDCDTSEWTALSWPHHGEYASTTNFITEQPSVRMNYAVHDTAISCIAVCSDGLERIVLDFARRFPFAPFFEGVFAPLWRCRELDEARALTGALSAFLMSDKVNSRTDDDKTLVLATLKSR
jgi:hypothetical protein